MKSHTPGPWSIHFWQHRDGSGVMYEGVTDGVEVYSAESVERHFQIVADPEHLGASRTYGSFEGCHIAKLDIVYDGHEETAGYDEALANARLIAAAPDLLAACKAAYDWLSRFGEHGPIIFGGEGDLSEILRSAIGGAEPAIYQTETTAEVS